ncbi:hypothetical protein AMTRI_Chr03g145590 [Amborella trichopoda]|uniref:EndoU domain-containing protein n=1 Tax=Amborella trichopoda TaxID=13333 RepID=U5CQN8_AMBTC|nr:poly(U)-specific endoribonuclease-B [Amborella trichopoda]ERN15491.1 hypothetical protein AMTR_s00048p00040650 [Amborella trichopoda]|eukprot:XP_006854024.1 poly(U)-specific endoribonuclease-B [Amborella trichopoda]
MEGLIKGLLDVALGQGNEPDSPSREERSRSTWAEVVSEGNDNEGSRPQDNYRPHHRQEEADDGWQNVGGYQRKHEEYPQHKGLASSQQYDNADSYASHEDCRPHRTDIDYPPRREGVNVNGDGWQTFSGHHRKQEEHSPKLTSESHHEYGTGYTVDTNPSKEELSDLSKACNRLWELDLNRLEPGKDYKIDCGEGKKVYQKEDMAQSKLFTWLNPDIFKQPTYFRFRLLLDNYNPNEGCKEVVTSQERQEQAAFIEEISSTAPIKYLHQYLVHLGIAPESYEDFKGMLVHLWFDLYNRGGASSSSAFEHVFVGEIKNKTENEVSGFHNWIQFYLEETMGRVDYQGYIIPRRHREMPDSETQLLTVQFEWNGILKSVSSTLVGVSPEFEIALYTLCFYIGEEDNHVQLGPYPVNIKCYRFGNEKIGSVFPIAQN